MQRQVIVTSFTNCSIANSIPLLHNNPKTNFHPKPKLTEILTFLKCMYTNGQTYHQPTTDQQTTGFKSYQNPPYHHTTKTDLHTRTKNTTSTYNGNGSVQDTSSILTNTKKPTPRGNTQEVDPENITNRPPTHRRYIKKKKKPIASVHNGINTRHPQTTDCVFCFGE